MLSMDKIEAPWLKDLKLDGAKVAVIGAYKGDTVAFIGEHHPKCQIYAYEPQIWAFTQLRNRFFGVEAINLFNYGIGVIDNEGVPLYEYGTDAASMIELPGWRSRDYVRIKNARKTWEGMFDFMLINIEGYEYDLIPYLMEHNLAPKEWMIQFHFYKDSKAVEYAAVREQLEGHYFRQEIGKGWEYYS